MTMYRRADRSRNFLHHVAVHANDVDRHDSTSLDLKWW